MKQIVIIGAGGHGRETLQLLLDINRRQAEWEILGFADGDPAKAGQIIGGLPVFGGDSWFALYPKAYAVIALGQPGMRARTVGRLSEFGFSRYPVLVHPSAQVSRQVALGPGTSVCAGCILTTDIVIGQHVIVNTGAVISHDCQVADFCTISPQTTLCGAVQIEAGADIGAGSTIIQGRYIGEGAVVGAGAVVIDDVRAETTVVGCPARAVGKKSQEWRVR